MPYWVNAEIFKYEPPQTGRVEIVLEMFQGGVAKLEIGGMVRIKPPIDDPNSLEDKHREKDELRKAKAARVVSY